MTAVCMEGSLNMWPPTNVELQSLGKEGQNIWLYFNVSKSYNNITQSVVFILFLLWLILLQSYFTYSSYCMLWKTVALGAWWCEENNFFLFVWQQLRHVWHWLAHHTGTLQHTDRRDWELSSYKWRIGFIFLFQQYPAISSCHIIKLHHIKLS